MEKKFTYSAFISYSSKNEKIAKTLWKKLEHYKVPVSFRKNDEAIPKKMHIFLDKGDIVPGDTVKNALSRELVDSKKLIVICSPDSAKSEYVDLEVSDFIEHGHSANDIIPYIIEGEVDKNSINNCYVPSLFGKTGKDTINGVSVVRDGRWKAFVGILANLLNVKFDDIYKREIVRRNKIITLWIFLAIILSFLIFNIIWYVKPHTKFYVDYITRWEIPEGIYELSKKQLKDYPSHYEITTQYSRPIKIVHANSKGFPVQEEFWKENFNRPIIAEYSYKNSFALMDKKKRQILDKVIYHFEEQEDIINPKNYFDVKLSYTFLDDSNSCYLDFYYNAEDDMRTVLSPDILNDKCIYYSEVSELDEAESFFFKNNSTIYRLFMEFDELGYTKSVKFLNKNNLLVSDINGITSWTNEFDNYGRIVAQNYIEDNRFLSKPRSQLKIKRKEIEYEENDIKKIRFLSQDGKAIRNYSRDYAEIDIDWQRKETTRCLKVNYLDENGKPCLEKKINGVSCMSIEEVYDENSLLEERTFFIERNMYKKLVLPDNYQFNLPPEKEETKYKYIRDELGRIIYISIYIDNKLKNNQKIEYAENGFIKFVENIDSNNNILEKMTFEREETPGILSIVVNSVETKTYKYDKYRRLIEQTVIKGKNTYSTNLYYYGDNKSICFFENGSYWQNKIKGFSRADFSYTNEGSLSYVRFRNSDGEIGFSNQLGFAEYKSLYSPAGFLLNEIFYNQNGEVVKPSVEDYAIYNTILNIDETYVKHGEYKLPNGEFPIKKSFIAFDTNTDPEGNLVIEYKKEGSK